MDDYYHTAESNYEYVFTITNEIYITLDVFMM